MLHSTAGPAIEIPGDMVGQLTNLQKGDVLFIDEIHRLLPAIEEKLYPAMEDYQFDLLIGQGVVARTQKTRAAKIHPDRRHHPAGSAHRAVARSFRHRLSSGLLSARRSGNYLQAFR